MRQLLIAAFLCCSAFAQAADVPAGSRVLDLLVADSSSGQPIAGAVIQVRWAKGNETFSSGADGHLAIEVPPDAVSALNITVAHNGYVGKILSYGRNMIPNDPIPATYTLKLDPAKTITGRVLDDAGQPIAGAHVVIQLSGKQLPNSHERVNVSYREVPSGDGGVWTFDGAPAEIARASIGAWDYRYVVDAFFPMNQIKSVATLFDGTDTVTLHRGVTVEGVVLGPDGLPAIGATVGIGADRVASNVVPEQKTDAKGHFTYVVAPGSHVVLTAIANGCAPDLKMADATGDKTRVDFELSAGKRLRGKVVGPDGQGIPNAGIILETWRGMRTIGQILRTDATGQFSWDQAPADAILANVQAEGFAAMNNVAMTAGGDAITVKVHSLMQVHGTVADAESGQPIDRFRMIPELAFDADSGPIPYNPNPPDYTTGGKFHYTISRPYPFYAVKIEADGYLPSTSRLFTQAEGDVALEFKLKKGEGITVNVLAPDGSPAAGVFGIISDWGQMAYIINGDTVRPQDEPRKLTAGADGQMKLPATDGAYLLVLFGPQGYAEADQDALAKSPTVKLGAWGRIHGKLLLAGKSGANQPMTVEMTNALVRRQQHKPDSFHQISTKTDADGNFAFDRVPPGPLQIGRVVEEHMGTMTLESQSPQVKLEIAVGQTINLQIGGDGRLVTGKAILPPEVAKRSDWNWSFCAAESNVIQLPWPDAVRDGTEADKSKWRAEFDKTDAGKAYQKAEEEAQKTSRYYPLQMSRDGTFRCENILPGEYQFEFLASGIDAASKSPLGGPALASGGVKFTVPPGPADQAVEIPPVQLKSEPVSKNPSP